MGATWIKAWLMLTTGNPRCQRRSIVPGWCTRTASVEARRPGALACARLDG
jgi:hypothetical protein